MAKTKAKKKSSVKDKSLTASETGDSKLIKQNGTENKNVAVLTGKKVATISKKNPPSPNGQQQKRTSSPPKTSYKPWLLVVLGFTVVAVAVVVGATRDNIKADIEFVLDKYVHPQVLYARELFEGGILGNTSEGIPKVNDAGREDLDADDLLWSRQEELKRDAVKEEKKNNLRVEESDQQKQRQDVKEKLLNEQEVKEVKKDSEKEVKQPVKVEEKKQPVKVEEVKQPVKVEEVKQPVKAEEVKQPVKVEEVKQPVKVDEKKQPVKVDEVKQPVTVEEVKQPVKAEEVKQPVKAEEVKQPVKVEEVKQPVKVEEVKQPVKVEEVKQPVKVEEKKQPVKEEEVKQPFKVGEVKQPVKVEEVKQPVKVEQAKQPGKVEETKQPVKVEEVKQPVKVEEKKQPVKVEEVKQPVKVEEVKQPVKVKEVKQPVKVEQAKQPVKVEEVKQPVKVEEKKQPVKVEEVKQPVKVEEVKQPVKVEQTKQPVKVEDVKQPVKVEEKKQPVKVEEKKQPVKVEEVKQPVKVEEVKQPVKVEEVKQPVKAEEVKQPVKAEEVKQPVKVEEVKQPVKVEQVKQSNEEQRKQNEELDRKNYKFSSITNDQDLKIHAELDEADELFEKENYEAAIAKYDEILIKEPLSARSHYGKGLTLDRLGFKYMSNDYLEKAIDFIARVLDLPDVPDELYKTAARKLADRQQFRGWGGQSVKTYKALSKRFPDDLAIKNEFGVSYMMIGQNDRARDIFKEVLDKDPDDGFAKVHLGFIFKTKDNNLELAVKYLKEGIDSKEPGTSDGRFYLHLGDSLQRLGQEGEARRYFEEGEKKGLFLSAWQRSLYNVDGLTGRPWWTAEQTGYQEYLTLLKNHWKTIRDEGIAQLDTKTGSFLPEEENLRETGDWKQFTLYQQGRKNADNCAKAPKTCALIDQIPAAHGCKRGQVKFSVMSPGIHVWPHVGPTNCRIRAHLGLVVPEGPVIRVMNETRTWREGEFIIFDDSFEHEVWHEGSELRLVLIVDFWHPELTEQQRRRLSAI